MSSPKEYGKIARKNGINAPTLDENLSQWLSRSGFDRKTEHYVEWWEGWYEALDESLAFQNVNFTRHHFVQGCR
jgi:hypothetical protein